MLCLLEARSKMAYDPRGVLRGPCSSCSCKQYSVRADGFKCVTCDCPPSKHANLTSPGATASGVQVPLFPPTPPMSYSGATAGYSGTASAQHLAAHPQKQHQQPASHTSHQMGIATQQPSYYSPSVIPQTTSQLPPSNLPRCSAVGCHQKVYYDYELGPFDYCSPECRDHHLLPSNRAALRADIAAFSTGKCKMPPLSLPSNATHSTQL